MGESYSYSLAEAALRHSLGTEDAISPPKNPFWGQEHHSPEFKNQNTLMT